MLGLNTEFLGPHVCFILYILYYPSCPLYIVAFDYQWRIQDFPEGGREPSRGGVNTPNFPENCMKSKEFGRPGGGVRPSRPPLDPPMITYYSSMETKIKISRFQKKTVLQSLERIKSFLRAVKQIQHIILFTL